MHICIILVFKEYNTYDRTDHRILIFTPETDRSFSPEARVAIAMGALASRLVQIECSRTDHPDGRAENVAEHSLMLARVAPELAALMYPGLNIDRIARLASVHDDVEAYVGDTPTDMPGNHSPTAKTAREQQGLERLRQEYANMPAYLATLDEYEAQHTPEARFVRAVDKVMVMLIQLPNAGATVRAHYTTTSYLAAEAAIAERDRHKFSEFDKIVQLRAELAHYIANHYLSD